MPEIQDNRTGYPAAVLWDMDGTLVDTEPFWIQARADLAAEYHVPWSDADASFFIGKPLPVSAAEMRNRGVPLAEPYLTAAASLGIRPRDCLAIEDTDTGAASAVAAGMTVLVIPHLGPVPDGPSRSTRETLTGVTLDDLRFLRPALRR
ncbi:haloacid dehalogenase superfamily, subfamily IA, variant 3 with third motif having DD or ED [Arthrobacter sp. ok909]|uniref:HAD family hydrolase n=1 Tax=Arthrobacter sp. ok909 TaxID=1761746 RepID=UPI0008820C1A|nr:HAD family hydrolase [Arthrobacter sp. ok909]SDO97338.1 haloacid dehalogenase superfamily, subfamily IA, variant 3 with third motif having DD or ED [Arthrobacter sp. ok909]